MLPATKKDYYRLTSVKWVHDYRNVEGVIIKYLTADEVESRFKNCGEIWVKIG